MNNVIKSNGKPNFGWHEQPVNDVNYRDFDCRNLMGNRASRLTRWGAFNRFQYHGVISDDVIFGCALADTRYVALAFVYVYEPKTGRMLEKTFRSPLGLGMSLCTSPMDGRSEFHWFGNHIVMQYDPVTGRKSIELKLKNGIEVNSWFDEADYEPMCITTRAGRNGWVYAQKAAGVAAHGQIKSPFGTVDLDQANAQAHHDFSAGYMRRETYWHWACFSGTGSNGERIGLNVSCGVNETSFSENCLWVDGKLHKLAPTHFDFDSDDVMLDWQVTSNDKKLNLDFEPAGLHAERINLGLLATDFKQIFGRFEGSVKLEDGRTIKLNNVWGFVEDQFARW